MSTLTPELSMMTSMNESAGLDQTIQQRVPADPSGVHAFSPLPFSLQCLGGIWDGYLIEWQGDDVQLRVTGFPPIELSQIIQLQYGVPGQEGPLKKFQGVVQDIHVESGGTAWEGTTNILLHCLTANGVPGYGTPATKVLPALGGGLVVCGQVLEGSFNSSRKIKKPERSGSPSGFALREREGEIKDGAQRGVHSSRLSTRCHGGPSLAGVSGKSQVPTTNAAR